MKCIHCGFNILYHRIDDQCPDFNNNNNLLVIKWLETKYDNGINKTLLKKLIELLKFLFRRIFLWF